MWRWGLQSQLPSNHPYKNFAPRLGTSQLINIGWEEPSSNYPNFIVVNTSTTLLSNNKYSIRDLDVFFKYLIR